MAETEKAKVSQEELAILGYIAQVQETALNKGVQVRVSAEDINALTNHFIAKYPSLANVEFGYVKTAVTMLEKANVQRDIYSRING